MSDHDPVCPFVGEPNRDPDRLCMTCGHIAAARADERERIARAIEAHIAPDPMGPKVHVNGVHDFTHDPREYETTGCPDCALIAAERERIAAAIEAYPPKTWNKIWREDAAEIARNGGRS